MGDRLEKVKIKPSQPAGAGARLSLAKGLKVSEAVKKVVSKTCQLFRIETLQHKARHKILTDYQ